MAPSEPGAEQPPGNTAPLVTRSVAGILPEEVFVEVLLGLGLGESIGMARSLGLDSEGIMVEGSYAYGYVTETTLALIDVLASNCGLNPEEYARTLAERADVENPLRLYHGGTARAVAAMKRGVPWWRARVAVLPGERASLDPAARATPMALFYPSMRSAVTMAVAQALVTHTGEEEVEAVAAYTAGLHAALHGADAEEAAARAAEAAHHPLTRELLSRAPDLAGEPAERAARLLDAGDGRPHPLAVVFYAASTGRPSEAASLASEVLGGDPVAAAAMAAALAAALRGLGGDIVAAQRLEAYRRLRDAAVSLRRAAVACMEGL